MLIYPRIYERALYVRVTFHKPQIPAIQNRHTCRFMNMSRALYAVASSGTAPIAEFLPPKMSQRTYQLTSALVPLYVYCVNESVDAFVRRLLAG